MRNTSLVISRWYIYDQKGRKREKKENLRIRRYIYVYKYRHDTGNTVGYKMSLRLFARQVLPPDKNVIVGWIKGRLEKRKQGAEISARGSRTWMRNANGNSVAVIFMSDRASACHALRSDEVKSLDIIHWCWILIIQLLLNNRPWENIEAEGRRHFYDPRMSFKSMWINTKTEGRRSIETVQCPIIRRCSIVLECRGTPLRSFVTRYQARRNHFRSIEGATSADVRGTLMSLRFPRS